MTEKFEISGLNAQDVWDYENGYYWFSHPKRLAKCMAHYELYQAIVDLPGDVMEFGVYKAASLVRFATFRHMLEADHSRKIFGFDAFGKFPTTDKDNKEDSEFIERFENEGGDGLSREQTQKILEHKNLYTHMDLIEGDIHETLPAFFEKNPHTRISLLHVDVDVYEPSKVILDLCWDRVVRGGIVVFDDYNAVAGETRAVDEFLEKNPDLEIQKLPFCHVPSFIVKP